jgi:hypothetical protein
MSEPLQTPLGAAWPGAAPWSLDDTEAWLTRFALPTDFRWDRTQKKRGPDGDTVKTIIAHQPVMPDYAIHKGYGFWLRTTPYFPGLFEEIHAIMARAPDDQELTPEWVAAQLLERKRAAGEQAGFNL